MLIELQCPQCACCFSPELGPWSCMGDGETLEDSLHAALSGRGEPACPACGVPLPINQEELGQMALEMLGQW